MKIGIDITTLGGIRGPGRVTRELIRSLSRFESGDRFFLYTPVEPPPLTLPGNFMLRRVPLRRGMPWLNFSLPLAAIRDRVDVMLFPANDCWMLPYTPSVVVIHDLAQVSYLKQYICFIDRLQNILQLHQLKYTAEIIITISSYTASELEKRYPSLKSKIRVVYDGYNQDIFFKRDNKSIDNKIYILFVSGFDVRKNVDNLIKAFKILNLKNRKEILYLKGVVENDVKYYTDVPGLVKKHGIEKSVVIDSTYTTDDRLAVLYNNASLLVMPSFIEGFGLPVLEAMACGCPVACSNAASLPEVGGDAALYFDPYDVNEMAAVMNKMLNDDRLRKELTAQGLARAKKFSWDVAGRQVYAVIKNIK